MVASDGGDRPTANQETLDDERVRWSGPKMGRSLPKVIVLLAIGAVIAAIYIIERRGAPSQPDSGIVYVNPSAGTAAPAPGR
jgi:hypothetical protein